MQARPTTHELTKERELARLESFATAMDRSIALPFSSFRIGWDAVIGLIPGIGDLVGMGLSAWVVQRGRKLGVGRATSIKMVGNVLIETLLGMIPLVGDLFDAGFRANVRNVSLIRNDLESRGFVMPKRESVDGN